MPDSTNCFGERIGCIPVLRKPEYGTGEFDRFGRPKPDWSQLIDADGDGFDIHNIEPNGSYRMTVVLPKHTRLIRYGTEAGFNTTPKGTEYEEVSLPYKKESLFYHEYEVIAESVEVTAIKEACVVDRGKAAPGFDCPGGGVQYLHSYNMVKLLNLHLIREIEPCRQK